MLYGWYVNLARLRGGEWHIGYGVDLKPALADVKNLDLGLRTYPYQHVHLELWEHAEERGASGYHK